MNASGARTPALALLALVSGCALNPATGERNFTAFMTLEDELRIRDQEHPKILARFGGAYDDPKLTAYVAELGMALAAKSEMPDLDFGFTILNTPVVNAFALPGGYIYVSRGLLALANSEAELAGVLAHEIGHVTARHAARRYSRHVLANFGAELLDLVTIGGMAEAARAEADAYIQGYTRDQEFEADSLGLRYLRAAGYDAGAVPRFLNNLAAYRALEAKLGGRPDAADRPLDVMASHPGTTERLQEVTAVETPAPGGEPRLGRARYLEHIDGLLFSDDPAQGFVRGTTFVHPGLGFRFEVPDGFHLMNGAHRVLARGPEDTLILFDVSKGRFRGPAQRYLAERWAAGMTLIDVETISVNGMETATGWNRVDTDHGRRDVRLVAIQFDPGTFYRFMFFTTPEATQPMAEVLRTITYSFRRLRPEERGHFKPLRVHVVSAGDGDTKASLAARMPFESLRAERFAVLNGLAPDVAIGAGDRLKIISE
ncbi:MAG: M48 family metalloprotease [Kiloniellales bacterium]